MKILRRLRRSIRKRYVRARYHNRFFIADYLGALFLVRLPEPMSRELAFRSFERDRIEHYMQLCKHIRPDVFIDLGANCGPYTCILLKTDSVPRAIACEPDRKNAILLRANLLMNNLLAHTNVYEVAVGRKAERLWLESGPQDNPANCRLAEPSGRDGYFVEVVPLDDIVTVKDKIIALKIDIEGHECEALGGMERTLAANRGVVQIESYDHSEEVISTMSRLKYRLIRDFRPDFVFLKE
jgi:FkbM family methyltransferase